jgi:hypothetical protein
MPLCLGVGPLFDVLNGVAEDAKRHVKLGLTCYGASMTANACPQVDEHAKTGHDFLPSSQVKRGL